MTIQEAEVARKDNKDRYASSVRSSREFGLGMESIAWVRYVARAEVIARLEVR